MGDSNPGLTGERPVFYHYTNNSPDIAYIDLDIGCPFVICPRAVIYKNQFNKKREHRAQSNIENKAVNHVNLTTRLVSTTH